MIDFFFLLGSFQCLMYLYHYPDVWYDYAMWHANNGSIDAAIKVFQRALKALPGKLIIFLFYRYFFPIAFLFII